MDDAQLRHCLREGGQVLALYGNSPLTADFSPSDLDILGDDTFDPERKINELTVAGLPLESLAAFAPLAARLQIVRLYNLALNDTTLFSQMTALTGIVIMGGLKPLDLTGLRGRSLTSFSWIGCAGEPDLGFLASCPLQVLQVRDSPWFNDRLATKVVGDRPIGTLNFSGSRVTTGWKESYEARHQTSTVDV